MLPLKKDLYYGGTPRSERIQIFLDRKRAIPPVQPIALDLRFLHPYKQDLPERSTTDTVMMSSVITSVKRPRPTSTARAKRVRTGCLTCRERHLKCDEGKPRCQNCTKSRRECRWGVRLSYMPTKIFAPKRIPYARRWEGWSILSTR